MRFGLVRSYYTVFDVNFKELIFPLLIYEKFSLYYTLGTEDFSFASYSLRGQHIRNSEIKFKLRRF